MNQQVGSFIPLNQEVMAAVISMLCSKDKGFRGALQSNTEGTLKQNFPGIELPKSTAVHMNSTDTWHLTVPASLSDSHSEDINSDDLNQVHGGTTWSGPYNGADVNVPWRPTVANPLPPSIFS